MYDPEGVDVAHAGGAIVEGTTAQSSLVKIPHYMVDKARATVPSKVVITGPDRRHRMELFKNQIYYGGGSDTPYTIDPYSGERRRSTYQDVKNCARVAQALPGDIGVQALVVELGLDVDMARQKGPGTACQQTVAQPLCFGSAVHECLDKHGLSATPMMRIALPEEHVAHGKRDQLLEEVGLDAAGIARRALEWVRVSQRQYT